MQLLTVHAVPKQRQTERDRANHGSPTLGVSETLRCPRLKLDSGEYVRGDTQRNMRQSPTQEAKGLGEPLVKN